MDPYEIAACDALQMFQEFEIDVGVDPCREALQAVLDAKPPARPLLLEVAQTRLEFHEAITLEPRMKTCLGMALSCIQAVLDVAP